jgi:hypothetical protein
MGVGAAVGAGTGLLAGSAVGAENARAAGGSLQARYDTVYAQCMSDKGNRVEVASYWTITPKLQSNLANRFKVGCSLPVHLVRPVYRKHYSGKGRANGRRDSTRCGRAIRPIRLPRPPAQARCSAR